ncbi:MAG: hypothetical protein ACREMK_15435 [Gemmatimonadota bacterium]
MGGFGLGEEPVGRLGQPVEVDTREDLAITIVGRVEQLLGDLMAALEGPPQEGREPLRDDRQARLLQALTPAAFGLATDLERQPPVLDLRAVNLGRGGPFQRQRLVSQLSGAVPLDAFGQELAEETVATVLGRAVPWRIDTLKVVGGEEARVTLVDLAQAAGGLEAGQDLVLRPLKGLEEDLDLGAQPLEARRSLDTRGISACNWGPPW